MESTFSPGSDQAAVGPDQSLWLAPNSSSSGCLSPHFLLRAEDFIVLFTIPSFYACFSQTESVGFMTILIIKIASWCFSVQVLLTVGISKE